MTADVVFEKITTLLRERGRPVPFGMAGLAVWLWWNLSHEELACLAYCGVELGEDASNRRLVKALQASGTYFSDDEEHVSTRRTS